MKMDRVTEKEEQFMKMLEDHALRTKDQFTNCTDVEMYELISDYFKELQLYSEDSSGERTDVVKDNYEQPDVKDYLMMISDFALSSARVMLHYFDDDSIDYKEYDDEVILHYLYKYFEQTSLLQADVGTNYCTNKKALTRYLSMMLSDNFLSNLEVGQEYSTGFQVIMKIEEVVHDETTNKVTKFVASDNEEEHAYTITSGEVLMNFEHQLNKGSYIYLPMLLKLK